MHSLLCLATFCITGHILYITEQSTIYSNLGTASFSDITSGSNGYRALTGWDFANGVGSSMGLIGK